MSGIAKVPPRGPRALLQSPPAPSGAAGLSNGTLSSPSKAVPTGPRSLLNGNNPSKSPPTEAPSDRQNQLGSQSSTASSSIAQSLTAAPATNKMAETMLSATLSPEKMMIPLQLSKQKRKSSNVPKGPRLAAPAVPPPPPAEPPPPPPPPLAPAPPPPPPPSVSPPPSPSPPTASLPHRDGPLFRPVAMPTPSKILPQSSAFATEKTSNDPRLPPPPPHWPPARMHYPPDRTFSVLFDPLIDRDKEKYSYSIQLMNHIKQNAPPNVVSERVKGKPGRECLFRFEGQTFDGTDPSGFTERRPEPHDPRRRPHMKKLPCLRSCRTEFHPCQYEYDMDSVGPPPPTSILVVNIPPLTPINVVKLHFGPYGARAFDSQIDRERGNALGIVHIQLDSVENARRCVAKENGRRVQYTAGALISAHPSSHDYEELKVVLDGDGSKLRAVLKELETRKRAAKDERKQLPSSLPPRPSPIASTSTSYTAPTPSPNPHNTNSGLPPKPTTTAAASGLPSKPTLDGEQARTPLNLVQARKEIARQEAIQRPPSPVKQRPIPPKPNRSRPRGILDHYSPSYGHSRPRSMLSGSPSSVHDSEDDAELDRTMRVGTSRFKRSKRENEQRNRVLTELATNGKEHILIEGGAQMDSSITDEDVEKFFEGFKVDKILRDHNGLYVTFEKADSAHRAEFVLNSSSDRRLGNHIVTLTVHPPPPLPPSSSDASRGRDPDAIIAKAERIILRELRDLLRGDILESVVGVQVRKIARKVKEKGFDEPPVDVHEPKPATSIDLKSLSFKKQRKAEHILPPSEPPSTEDDVRLAKKPRHEEKTGDSVVEQSGFLEPEIESEEEEEPPPLKRRPGPLLDDEGPPKKKQKKIITKKSTRQLKKVLVVEPDPELDGLVPSKVDIPVQSPTPPPVPPLPLDDAEDHYLAKLILSGPEDEADTSIPDSVPLTIPSRKHVTGSARTEGFYQISHAEKAVYVAQYQARTNANTSATILEDSKPQQPVTSSRSNRADARRRAQGLEEINAVQRAVALSKGETPSAANELMFKFNQLQTRKKHLRFARSPIHDWGLYAMEKISRGEMVIEYVGEIIRAQVAEKREKTYERQGIGSSYLFRIDEDLVVDATKKGNLGRLINHSCDPNCTAKIITINGEKKIVIYAKQDIELGDEITYDYHFPFEQDKIPCLCGSAKCRGFLN